jgi:hypothetical protein
MMDLHPILELQSLHLAVVAVDLQVMPLETLVVLEVVQEVTNLIVVALELVIHFQEHQEHHLQMDGDMMVVRQVLEKVVEAVVVPVELELLVHQIQDMVMVVLVFNFQQHITIQNLVLDSQDQVVVHIG